MSSGAGLSIDDPAYFELLAELEQAHWWSRGMWRLASHWLDRALAGRTGLCALDAGCGAGFTLARLAARADISRVVGVEPNPHALARARQHGRPCVQGDARALPFAENCFDVITCFDVLQHLDSGGDERALRELNRVLRDEGVVVVRTNAARRARGAAYSRAKLVRAVTAAGFDVVRVSYANCLPALAQELRSVLRQRRARRHAGHPAGGGLRMRMPGTFLNRLMTQVTYAEASLAGRHGRGLPYGHSLMVVARKRGQVAFSVKTERGT
jgi:ubiquinone/menaquinone biosynthesis C-methylase UbiE